MIAAIAQQRLQRQCITGTVRRRPADVVAWLGAVQAQEYPAARWGLGLRMPEGTTDDDVQRAFDEGRILRTHVLRPTWHFVTPADIRWMLALTAPHVHARVASYNRRLGLDTGLLVCGARTFERALGDGQYLTRRELGARLERAGIALDSLRLAHVALYAELEGVMCSGPRRASQFTYALLANRAAEARRLTRDEALAELTLRYFRSHGPATIRDFVWWSGLRSADAKRGLEINRARHEVVGGRSYWTLGRRTAGDARRRTVHLLPIYDEYLVAYRDRDAVPHGPAVVQVPSGRSTSFQHALVSDGQIAGTWRIARTPAAGVVEIVPLRRLTRRERESIEEAAAHYGRFLNAPVSVSVA